VRPPEAVLDDVLDEYVSVEGARRDYGVVLSGSLEELTLEIDRAATETRRAEMRGARPAGPDANGSANGHGATPAGG